MREALLRLAEVAERGNAAMRALLDAAREARL